MIFMMIAIFGVLPLLLVYRLRRGALQRSHWAASWWVDFACLPFWGLIVGGLALFGVDSLRYSNQGGFFADTLLNGLYIVYLLCIPLFLLVAPALIVVPGGLWFFTGRQISQKQVDKVLMAQRKRLLNREQRRGSGVRELEK